MAQAATMGPPLSPREIRRSGRRSAPSASTSASKSPDADLPPPKQKDTTQRASQPSRKRTKDDTDDHPDDRKHSTTAAAHSSTSSNSSNSKGKRKHKEKDKQRLSIDVTAEPLQDPVDDKTSDPPEEEEQGITRCVCGSNGDDEADAGEFMVQCETCKVWQHGLCMGYESEDQVHDADYYCELCRPELHAELLKKLAKKARQSSAVSHPVAASRLSRSHSPTHLKQPSKRRNTMNSRDAAFDESLKEIIEASAAEAAAAQENPTGDHPPPNISKLEPEDEPEVGSNNKRKRKRIEDDAPSKKRTRSASTASDPNSSSIPRPPTSPPKPVPATNTTKPGGRAKRTARKTVPAPETSAPLDGDETTQPATATTTKRHGGNTRSKATGTAKRPPILQSNSHGNNNMSHEQGSRRGPSHNTNNQGGSTLESTRAYRNSHAYAVSQQPLFTSWGLPDYLAHLEEMLPTNTPQPLEIHSGVGSTGAGRESMERTMERGVKVKWPSKRTSVGDMNKRVRALVEWVGREQANALDRERRKNSLETALKQESETSRRDLNGAGDDSTMLIDGSIPLSYSGQNKTAEPEQDPSRVASSALWKTDDGKPMSTMKMMEELMEELIGFQERFGPGAKTRERERRSLIAS
ncbi:hypothetical protein AGABI1DRAFT_127043 [Agaricus bisporus var. burnettii JB137-S8]|uniref:PHD-type domain-containing protein n=1 Tax=Agaricus bisporus var. burnettii (strain JB137-S8 / ATCC MYA-4627 / FGSC 10392) TaxID=597362 RepID=K5XCX1_AGABU|nr:uncharacterized protein AGABI1DRAFT_127043 [Agaricus bisporus var. burnettii JB137-S8]EKM80997.1 hypothetical protein AGABI1DRAFT_127043 [Agaricus bisporus var. burnettii JB137-S8]